MEAIYQISCPSCGGDIKRSRLVHGLHCDRCEGKGGLLAWRDEVEAEYETFVQFLKEKYGIEPWGPQRAWAKWMLSGSDVVIGAPTGIGKSTLLAAYADYSSLRGKRVLYIVPSRTLVQQVEEKVGKGVTVTTIAKVMRNISDFKGYDVVIIDDVDSALRSPKTVETIMKVIGLDDVVEKVNELVRKFMGARSDKEIKEFLDGLKKLKEDMPKRSNQLIFASASGSEGNFKARLMLSVLGIKPSPFPPTIRNVTDCKVKVKGLDDIVKIVKDLVEKGYSGVVFVHEGGPFDEIVKKLKINGIKVGEVKSGKLMDLKRFERGELQVLVASASRYGVLARGIDLPDRFRFAVFVEPPHRKLETVKLLRNPLVLAKVAHALGLDDVSNSVMNKIKKLSKFEIDLITNVDNESLNPRLRAVQEELSSYIKKVIREIKDSIRIGNLVVGKEYSYRVDVKTYLQASGRTSRLTKDGFTHGVSIVAYTNDILMDVLEKGFKKKFCEGIAYPSDEKKKYDVKTALMIVESPTKARTITSFNGGGSINFDYVKVHTTALEVGDRIYFLYIMASKGHVYDLTLDEVGHYGIIINDDEVIPVYAPVWRCERCKVSWSSSDGRCPKCGLPGKSSLEIVKVAQKISTFVDEVLLATDPDEEGEKIAWDLFANIKPFNNTIYRVRYNEITKRAIVEAIKNKGSIDENLVMSQILRRMDDRVVGFKISEELWRALGTQNAGLGRVQGPVLKMLVERKLKWVEGRGYSVILKLENGDVIRVFKRDRREAEEIVKLEYVEVVKLDVIDEARPPLPPFTTDSLLEEADRRLRLDASTTMKLAQDLFEMGFITYHRTDSTRVSDVGIQVAKEWISERFGEEEFVPRRWGEGGAHEAIRPTKPLDPSEVCRELTMKKADPRLCKLYKLIFDRFMASQMRESILYNAIVTYRVGKDLITKHSIVGYENKGWVLVNPPKVTKIDLSMKTPKVTWRRIIRSSTNPLPTLSSVIKWMKDNGIGRPSTYARTIESLRRHGFIVISPRANAVIATKKGALATEYVKQRMPELLSVDYTRGLEEVMELIKSGELDPTKAFRERVISSV